MNIYEQIKRRRHQLSLTQKDMQQRIGMPRQQYQRLEAGGNPRLDTLALVAEGLNADVMLIPREKLHAVSELLAEDGSPRQAPAADVDPWHGLLDTSSEEGEPQ